MKTKTTITTWARVLADLAAGKPAAEQEKAIKCLAALLKRKKKDYLLPKILETAGKIAARKDKVELVLAHEADKETKELLNRKLKESLGKDKNVEIKLNESIIGGFVAKTEDYLIDASVKKYLNQLKRVSLEEI
jgi:F0F1-type ATP synthase delta subunit